MTGLAAVVLVLVVVGSLLAVAEASISRMTRARAVALREQGRRNGALLERIARDPAPYLNAVYLAVMLVQNGSAVLVAVMAEARFGQIGIALVSVAFTLAYFVIVEAMAKTFGIQHNDRAALAAAPLVLLLRRMLAIPARGLIGLANILLPGKGLEQGPFVAQQEIRSMAEAGHEEGAIEQTAKEMIDSIFEFGEAVVRQVMVPRPDIVAVEVTTPFRAALDVMLTHRLSRVPVYRGDLDRVEGVLHAKDALAALHLGGDRPAGLAELLRPAHFVPETKRAADLLREMRRQKFHMAIAVDEYGSTSGLVTLEDLLEELVGEIADEHDVDERDVIEAVGDGVWRVDASATIGELNERLGTALSDARWNTVGGLMFGVLGTIPAQGQSVVQQGYRFTAERVQGRRVTVVMVTREPEAAASEA